jgi:hypothetical protein
MNCTSAAEPVSIGQLCRSAEGAATPKSQKISPPTDLNSVESAAGQRRSKSGRATGGSELHAKPAKANDDQFSLRILRLTSST